jgi:hypothetical protein
MKIAIYSKENKLLTVYENINNPKLKDSAIYFDGGSFSGITDKHILIDNEIEPSEELTIEMVQLDKKGSVETFKTLEEQQAERIANLEDALLILMDMI